MRPMFFRRTNLGLFFFCLDIPAIRKRINNDFLNIKKYKNNNIKIKIYNLCQ
jgi:hypothetical protein